MQYHLFERFGVELEYMIVDASTLDVRPIADQLIHSVGSARKNEVRHGRARWSNELVLHVIELKTDGPQRKLDGLAGLFQDEVRHLNGALAAKGCRLLPGGMHPWMDPMTETRLWPHGSKEIYNAFDRIFDCRGHGWSNLQSTHINLPFSGDAEFERLHTAIRLLLPLLPALAASSPYVEGRAAPFVDMRLEAYRHNCERIPMITGQVVPERMTSREQYEREILQVIYDIMAPLDPEGVLRDEWVNARGAIARFSRGTIEIRVLDIQECPAADLAVVQFIVAILRALVDGSLSSLETQGAVPQEDLSRVLLTTMRNAEAATVDSPPLLAALGMDGKAVRAGEVLRQLLDRCAPADAPWRAIAEHILAHGSLATRLLRRAGPEPTRARLGEVYGELASCLAEGRLFRG